MKVDILSLCIAFLAVILAIIGIVQPELNWTDIEGKPTLFTSNDLNLQQQNSFVLFDDFESNLHWSNEVGIHGIGSGVHIGTTYVRYLPHSLNVTTRSTGATAGDYEFANWRAPVSGNQVIQGFVVRFRGYMERWYNSYTQYAQFEVAINNGTHTLPAEIRFDVPSGNWTAKTINGTRQVIAQTPALNSAAWTEFELDVNFYTMKYLRLYINYYNSSVYIPLELDLSNIPLSPESETGSPNINFFLGVVSKTANQCMIWFDDVNIIGVIPVYP